ncbi:superoxide dismutase SOD2 [Cardiosporidium cionae]|uniref:Superoxide dismutase n=1 Tax=Cardiosporidium cionae TaxID=476202 RepID=A0ABQ7J7D6_9APIC|nr:superoxide dismutase SOD2 [Cardiosporidium cionae]|eukprot:KAF8819890.1 superoxide dismutase SOD2 [Cardiosporidium cionae]
MELAPLMSKQTIKLHYGKHHAGYVRKLNGFMRDYPHLIGKTLEDIIRTEDGALFNNAAQIWNHNFFWSCLKPRNDNAPHGAINELIKKDFGSFERFKLLFSEAATGHFGSGWVWLIQKYNGTLTIESTHDAGNPIKTGSGIPLLVIDVWEHAYYVDYYNDRAAYVKAWFNIIDWNFVNTQLR